MVHAQWLTNVQSLTVALVIPEKKRFYYHISFFFINEEKLLKHWLNEFTPAQPTYCS